MLIWFARLGSGETLAAEYGLFVPVDDVSTLNCPSVNAWLLALEVTPIVMELTPAVIELTPAVPIELMPIEFRPSELGMPPVPIPTLEVSPLLLVSPERPPLPSTEVLFMWDAKLVVWRWG